MRFFQYFSTSSHQSNMKKVTLKFPSLPAIWDFMQVIQANFVHVNAAKRTLTCDCNEHDIEIAVKNYKAVVMKKVEVVKGGKE